jgi:hypothetical protein
VKFIPTIALGCEQLLNSGKERWNERRCAYGFASRIQRFNENRRPGAD